MLNKEQMMEKTKLELNKMLAQVGNNISASKLKNTNKETLVQMLIDAETVEIIAENKGAVICDQETLDAIKKNAETESIINEEEPKNIDEMFDGKVVSLADVKNEKNLKNGKTPKSSSRPDYDKLYDQFKKALIKHGVNIFAGRTNRLGEMKALTHVKGMQWAVLITKTGFRFELFMMDDQKGIEEVYNEIDRVEEEKTLSLDLPTGKSKRYKISMTHDGHDAEFHAQMFSDFYEILMIEIAELYPLPKSETKTA